MSEASRPAYVNDAYEIVSGGMEDSVGSLLRMATLLQLAAESSAIQREHGDALSELSERMIAAAGTVEAKRAELCRLLHPRREEFEREGAIFA